MEKMEEKVYSAPPDETNGMWTSCCFKCDKHAVSFFSQLTVSLIVLIFCIYQRTCQGSCEAQALYSGMLTLVLGTWLPQPQVASKEKG